MRFSLGLLFIPLFFLGFSTQAWSGWLKADAIMVIPKDDFAKIAGSQSGRKTVDIRQKFDDIKLPLEIDTFVSDIFFNSTVDFSYGPDESDRNKISYTVNLRRPVIEIGKILVKGETIIRGEDGREIRIPSEGECTGLRSTYQLKKVTAVGTARIISSGGKLQVKVGPPQIVGPQGGWNSTIASCVEKINLPALEKRVNEGLTSYLDNNFFEELRPVLAQRIHQETKGMTKSVAQRYALGRIGSANVRFETSRLQFNQHGAALVHGQLITTFKNSNFRRKVRLKISQRTKNRMRSEQLLLPSDIIKQTMQAYHRHGLLFQRVPESRFTDFQKLRGSWFARSTVWPDLGNFRDSDRFLFDFQTAKRSPGFYWYWGTPGGILTKMYADFRIRTRVQTARGTYRYVDFHTYQRGKACMLFSSRGLSLQFGPMKNKWNYQYAPRFRNGGRIAVDRVTPMLQEKLEDLNLTIPMGALKLDPKVTYYPHKVTAVDRDIWSVKLSRHKPRYESPGSCRKFFQPHVTRSWLKRNYRN